ncbi:MAG: flagellar basal body rod protein FlgC [Candidatus Korobacteraceae bacterium]|jgi:flagellar basal-body rod protein FlgC
MNLFGMMEISASALGAERIRAEVVTSNLANAESTRTSEGGPYQRREVVFAAQRPSFALSLASAGPAARDAASTGVRVREVVNDPAPALVKYEPSHPDANADGYVAYPNVNPVSEMADLMGAARAYEMNVSAITAAKQMIQQSIEILK